MKRTNIHGKPIIEMELNGGARIVITEDLRAEYESRGFTEVVFAESKPKKKKSKKSKGE